MELTDLISVEQFCTHYKVPVSFINQLQELDLIEIIRVEKTLCLPKSQIKEVEKIIRLHYELQINLEGVDAIYNLLKQVETLQEQIVRLNNKLNFYKNL
ncbi:chaperone modulator CbpM [uncultured Polaribacter sp.]|uniref:chaperone modulator CbpM n=1 Tax=uncultured Polaribacter sp. TaxID=174711 RepID=UPI00261E7E2D|nr:chaperone modulator CbpM [uncultured Polaribacter sp.]